MCIRDRSGTANKAKLVANTGLNNGNNPVKITQAGMNNETYAKLTGNTNQVTVMQAGTGNTIGTCLLYTSRCV